MRAVAKFFYVVWVLSLPFYSYSIIGTLSLDNMLAPLVLALSALKHFSSPRNKLKRSLLFSMSMIFGIYAIGVIVSVINDFSYVKIVTKELVKHALYFFIPILFIHNFKDLKLTIILSIMVATIGCISVFLAALGLVNLEISRVSPSRLPLIGLPKSIGLLGNYGDLAIMSSMALLTIFGIRGFLRKTSARFYMLVIIAIVLIGYLGAQSRSMALAILSSVGAYWYVKKFFAKGSSASLIGVFLLIVGVCSVLAIVLVMSVDVVDSLAGWGGAQASATAEDRLGQYAYAWSLVKSSPFFGDGKSLIITGMIVHNLWMDTMAKGGIVSAVAMFLMFYVTAKRSLKKQYTPLNREISAYSTGVLCAIFVAGQFYGGFTYVFLYAFGVCAAAMTLTMKPVPVLPRKKANLSSLQAVDNSGAEEVVS